MTLENTPLSQEDKNRLEAENLLDEFLKHEKGAISQQIIHAENKLGHSLTVYREELFPKIKKHVLCNQSCISGYLKFLRAVKNHPEYVDEGQREKYIETKDHQAELIKIKESLKLMKILIEDAKNHKKSKEEGEKAKNSKPVNDFSGCKWFAYYLHYRKGEEDEGEPLIACAEVEIEKDTNKIKYDNTGEDDNLDYVGSYTADNDMEGGIIRFELEPKDEGEKGRQLHIKLFCRKKEQEISVGQYLTYKNGRIQSGEIVFFNQNGRSKDFNLERGAFSFGQSPTKFSNIPSEIRDFLALRSKSFNRVQNNIYNLDLLTTTPLKKAKYSRAALFLEKEEPQLFMAFPISGSSSYNQSFVKDIEDKMEITFPNLKICTLTDKEGFDKNGKPQPLKNIEFLKAKRFFILFSDGVEKISYSYMQLGWALLVCKVVIIIGKRREFSETVRNLNKDFVKIINIPVNSDLQTEWENGEILRKLNDIIPANLPKTLDGNMKI